MEIALFIDQQNFIVWQRGQQGGQYAKMSAFISWKIKFPIFLELFYKFVFADTES